MTATIWDARPAGLTRDELIAWALCQLAAAVYNHSYEMNSLGDAIHNGSHIIADAIRKQL